MSAKENQTTPPTEKGLDTLQVWRTALHLAVQVCKEILTRFPIEEKWALSNQLRRSVQSIPANIAEGYGRYYFQETIRFCYIARGSLEETYTHLLLAKELGYVSGPVFDTLNEEIKALRHSINGYILYLKNSRRGENEPGAMSVREESPEYITMLDYES